MIWVFLVSISARGWIVSVSLSWLIFLFGIAFIVARIAEWLGLIRREVLRNRAPRV
jgi:uncharacterized membrane protein YecN with MAPEG domain